MFKALAKLLNGRYLVVIGLSEANIRLLKEGKPISFDPLSIKLPRGAEIQGLTLFYGKDEADLQRQVADLIGPQTEVHVVPRGNERPQ